MDTQLHISNKSTTLKLQLMGESQIKNLKSAIKIQNTAQLSCKMPTVGGTMQERNMTTL
jgi:hypothetical protein